jgi:hypothetical protein
MGFSAITHRGQFSQRRIMFRDLLDLLLDVWQLGGELEHGLGILVV